MDLPQILFFLLGMFFLVCALTHSVKSALSKAKKMKLDPDWINFTIALALFAFGVSFVLLLINDAIYDFNESF